jgi:hypothetical protein
MTPGLPRTSAPALGGPPPHSVVRSCSGRQGDGFLSAQGAGAVGCLLDCNPCASPVGLGARTDATRGQGRPEARCPTGLSKEMTVGNDTKRQPNRDRLKASPGKRGIKRRGRNVGAQKRGGLSKAYGFRQFPYRGGTA